MSVLTGAVVGAIAGALGGVVGFGLSTVIWADREPADRPRWLSAACVVVMLAVSRPIAEWWDTPSVDELMSQIEASAPTLPALKVGDPSRYAEVRAAVEQAQAGTITQADEADRVHNVLMKAYLAKLPTAPDDLVQLQSKVVSAEYSAMQGTPDVCVSYITGSQPLDIRQYLPSNLVGADQDMMARVLRSPPAQPVRVASSDEVQKAAAPILVRIAQNERVSIQQVQQALNMKGDQALTCRVFGSLLQQISSLPTPQSASITRGLLRMSQS